MASWLRFWLPSLVLQFLPPCHADIISGFSRESLGPLLRYSLQMTSSSPLVLNRCDYIRLCISYPQPSLLSCAVNQSHISKFRATPFSSCFLWLKVGPRVCYPESTQNTHGHLSILWFLSPSSVTKLVSSSFKRMQLESPCLFHLYCTALTYMLTIFYPGCVSHSSHSLLPFWHLYNICHNQQSEHYCGKA